MKTIEKNPDVVILGGGLAGLSAGYELTKVGKKVLIIEKENDVGGLARTIKVGKFSFDTGPHRWYTKNSVVDKWMLSLLGSEVIKVPRLTRIYFDKKFFYYPIKIGNAMKGIGFYKAFKSLVDYFIARVKFELTKKQPHSLEEGYINQFGKTLYKIFFKRYSEKLWGRKCTQISADWISQRSRGFNITTILKDTFIRSNSQKVVSFVDEFSYPQKGIGQLSWVISDSIKKSGGEILLESQVIKVKHTQSKIESIVIKTEKNEKEIKANQFISSIPLSDFVLMLSPKAPFSILKVNQKLKYRDEVQVVLFVNKEKITSDTWIYVHPFELPYVRIMEMDNWSRRLSPKGQTALVFEIACNKGDKIWKKDDQKLINLVADSYINEFNLIKKENILGGYVHRVTNEYPVYHLDYKKDVDFLKNYLKRFDNLQLIGRNGTFRYNNMDHSIEMGLYAAWNIITGEKEFDIESVNIEREYLEEKRIENPEDEKVEKKDMNKKGKNIYTFLLLVIILCGIFLRFYKYSSRISLGADSNRDAFVAIDGAINKQFPLTGPFISIAPVTTGPWYWYQLIITRILIPIEYSPWIYLGLLSSFLILIVYRIGILLESPIFGLILSLIVAFSPQQIKAGVELTNPSVIGFFSTVIIWLFLEIIIKKRSNYWGYLLGFILGITVNSHYQSSPLFLFIIFLLFYKRYHTFRNALISFILTFIPLLFFEFNNHWFNTRNIIDYLRFDQYKIWVSIRWLTFISDFWPRFWVFVIGGQKFLGLFFMFSSSLIFLKQLQGDRSKRKLFILLVISFIIEVIIIRYYRGEKFFGYLQFFHPYIFLFTGYVLYSFFQKKMLLGFVATVVYLILVLPYALKSLQPDSLTVELDKIHKEIISKWGDQKYSIFDCLGTDINRARGLSLLFVLRGNFNPESANRLIYYYGSCGLPNFVRDERIINPDLIYEKDRLFPKIDIIYNVSEATEGAILEKGGVKFTTAREYQKAARWWFDEQP